MLRRVLIFLGVLADPDGPRRGSRAWWVSVVVPVAAIAVLVVVLAGVLELP